MNKTSHYANELDLNLLYQFLPTLCADEIGRVHQYIEQLDQWAGTEPNSIHRIIHRERAHQVECCPHCGAIHFVKNGKTVIQRQKYLCRECGRSFSDTTGTIIYHSRKNYTIWDQFIKGMEAGLVLRKQAIDSEISVTTAFHWRHKVIDSLRDFNTGTYLSGEIEMDETYFLLNMKGMKNLPRKPKKRGTRAEKRGVSDEQVSVAVATDEFDQLQVKIVGQGNPTTENMIRIMGGFVTLGSTLVTDSRSLYQEFARKRECPLIQIPSGFHTAEGHDLGTLNGIHSEMKSWFAKFRGVSTRHLQGYLDWFRTIKHMKYHIEAKEREHHLLLFSVSDSITSLEKDVFRRSFPIDIYKPYKITNQYLS